MRLFQIKLAQGRSHPENGKWVGNVSILNGKAPDYGGLNNLALVASGGDETYVHVESTKKMRKKRDVEVEEVTTASLQGRHAIWQDLVATYFSYVSLK